MRSKSCDSIVIAIDGMSAAYKSSVSKVLCDMLGAFAIHCDDFFLPMELRTEERLEEPGGNIHYERLKVEVIDHLREGKCIEYRRFDCGCMDYAEVVSLPPAEVYIVEGAYAMHPYLGRYYDLAVFMKVDADEQLERISKRNGDITMFQERWIPMEMHYISECDVESRAGFIIDTTSLTGEEVTKLIKDRITKL